MHYNLIITERAEELIDERLNYLVHGLKKEQAARHLLDEIDNLYDGLEDNPFQFADSRDSFLKSKGYKEAFISNMDYVLLFIVENYTVYIAGFFHQLENYNSKL